MSKKNKCLIGTAGEHFVAYKLSCYNIIPAMTREGSPSVDIIASNIQGTKTLTIQVKTTNWAERNKGRGKSRKPYELQFPLGPKSAKISSDNLFFTFVDLNEAEWDEKEPDVYILPSKYVYEYCKSWVDKTKWVRFHIEIKKMDKFKNNWKLIVDKLKKG